MTRAIPRLLVRATFCGALLGGALLGTGCNPPPEVVLVDPGTVEVASGVALLVRGNGFELDYNAFVGSVSGDFSVSIGGVDAGAVTWIDSAQLQATLPAEVETGAWSVTVTTSYGEDTLDDGLVVLSEEDYAAWTALNGG